MRWEVTWPWSETHQKHQTIPSDAFPQTEVKTGPHTGARPSLFFGFIVSSINQSQVWSSELKALRASGSSSVQKTLQLSTKSSIRRTLGHDEPSAHNIRDISGAWRLCHPWWFLRIKGGRVRTSNLFTAWQPVGAAVWLKMKLST